MRISTQLMYDTGTKAIGKQQAELYRTQQQLSSGKRVMAPSDDPIASSRAVVVAQAQAGHEQYTRNLNFAKNSLAISESVLGDIGTVLSDAKILVLNAGSGALQDADRQSIAMELRGKFAQLLGLVNSQDGTGKYLFSGYQEGTQPFSGSLSSVSYNGDSGEREARISPSQLLAVGHSGEELFRDIKNGNGTFAGAAAAGNLGSGVLQNGQLIDSSLWNGDSFEIKFNVLAGTTTYDIVNTTTAVVVSAGSPFVSGENITFDGVQVAIKGNPADTDSFLVSPSQNQSVFETIKKVIVALETSTTSGAAKAQLQNRLNQTSLDLDQATNHVLAARTEVGAAQKQVEDLASANDVQKVQRQAELAELQDLDYAKAISDYTRQMTILEAAQRTQANISKLSLFNFI
jgi:flagellar hook-associated protein 3 FlgL